MLKLKYDIDIDQYGRMQDFFRLKIRDDLKQFALKKITLTIVLFVKRRSSPQNAYYWGVVVPILMKGFLNVGYLHMNKKDRIHNWMKSNFLRDIIQSENEDLPPLGTIRSTTELNTIEFCDIMLELKHWSHEFLGVKIPDPDPNWRNREHESYSDNLRL